MIRSKKLTSDEEIQKLDAALTSMDTLRVEAMQNAETLGKVKYQMLERELQRLAVKLGEDHPRVKALKLRQQHDARRLQVVEAEKVKIRQTTPAAAEDEWTFQGRVIDSQGTAKKNLVIGLADKTGKWLEKFGYARTNEDGYFTLKYKITDEKLLPAAVFVMVSERDQKVLGLDPRALVITAGNVDFMEIQLKSTDAPVKPAGGGIVDGVKDQNLWKVVGRIQAEAGKSAKGLQIRIVDKKNQVVEKIPVTRADENGDYEIAVRMDKLPADIAAGDEIYVQVLDATGKILSASKKAYRLSGGNVESFNPSVKTCDVRTVRTNVNRNIPIRRPKREG